MQASQLVLVISLYHRNCPEATEHPISGTESHMLWTLVDSDTPSIPLSLSLSVLPSLPPFLPPSPCIWVGFLSSSLLVEVYAPIPNHQDVRVSGLVSVSSKLIFLLTESRVIGHEWNVVHPLPPLPDRVLMRPIQVREWLERGHYPGQGFRSALSKVCVQVGFLNDPTVTFTASFLDHTCIVPYLITQSLPCHPCLKHFVILKHRKC